MITISSLIATKAQIKTLLGISATTYDTLIDAYLPLLQDDLLNNILGNNFGAGYDESEAETVQPVFPQELRLVMAEYVNQKVIVPYGKSTTTDQNVISFSIGDYSETRDKTNLINGVDKSIFASAIATHKKIYKDEPVKTVIT